MKKDEINKKKWMKMMKIDEIKCKIDEIKCKIDEIECKIDEIE